MDREDTDRFGALFYVTVDVTPSPRAAAWRRPQEDACWGPALAIQSRSLTSLQQRLFKTAGHLIRHARYFILQLAESHLTPTLFRQILGRIERLAWHPT